MPYKTKSFKHIRTQITRENYYYYYYYIVRKNISILNLGN